MKHDGRVLSDAWGALARIKGGLPGHLRLEIVPPPIPQRYRAFFDRSRHAASSLQTAPPFPMIHVKHPFSTSAGTRRTPSPAGFVIATLLLLAGNLGAQVAAPVAAGARDDADRKNETVVLSPFEVRTDTDTGYIAANSLMGGRINTALKDTPAAVSVITRQFLDDIAATGPATMAEWALNIVPDYEGSKSAFGNFNFNMRNLGATNTTRNYFQWNGYADDYNVDRYEFARGPNGTIYGDTNLGGIPTTWSKRANFGRTRTTAKFRVDSEGSARTSLDYNLPVNQSLAVRFNGVRDRTQDWFDVPAATLDAGAIAGTYKVSSRDIIRIDAELGHYVRPHYARNPIDQAGFWDGATSFNGVATPNTIGTGIARVSTGSRLVYVPGAGNGGLNNMAPFYTSVGTQISIQPDARPDIRAPRFPVLTSRDYVMQPDNTRSNQRFYTYTLAWEHRFTSNLLAEIAYNRSDATRMNSFSGQDNFYRNFRIDVNTVLPGNGAGTFIPNPNFGRAYDEQSVAKHLTSNINTEVHALVHWNFATSWLKQAFTGFTGSRMGRFNTLQTRLTRTNPPAGTSPLLSNDANIVYVRQYWDQPGKPLEIPVVAGQNLEFVAQSEQHQRKALDYWQLASTSRFFSDRLVLMLGYREDHVIDSQHQTANIPVDPVNGLPRLGAVIITPTSPIVPVPVVGAKIHTDRKSPSKNAGAVYWLEPWLGLVGSYAESIASNTAGASMLDGTIPGITHNQGLDYGIRLQLFEGRLSGSFSYYLDKQQGNLLGSANNAEINRIWSNIGRLDVPTVDHRDTQDKDGRGWEFEVTGNPTRELRLTWNLGLPKSILLNFRPGLRKYLNANLAEWQAGANNPAIPAATRTQIANDILAIQNTLNSATIGTPVNDTYNYRSNIYATYAFTNELFKGFEFGAGANLRGRNKVSNNLVGDQSQSLYAPAYYLASAHLSYRHKLGKKLAARYQLNVTNLLDNDAIVYVSTDRPAYATYREANLATNPLLQVPSGYRQQDPRKVIFTTTFEF